MNTAQMRPLQYLLERESHRSGGELETVFPMTTAISHAISAKRSADALEAISKAFSGQGGLPLVFHVEAHLGPVTAALEAIAKHLAPVNVDGGAALASDQVLTAYTKAREIVRDAIGDGLVHPNDARARAFDRLVDLFGLMPIAAGGGSIEPHGHTIRELDIRPGESLTEALDRELDGFRPTGAATAADVGKGAVLWFKPDNANALAIANLSDPIEVRFRADPSHGPSRRLARMPLGDAIEWSTMPHAGIELSQPHRTLKASIAEWRPLL